MAKIFAQVIGGEIKSLEANTVAEVKKLMEATTYTASVNEEPATDDQVLQDRDYVALATSSKGALRMYATYQYNLVKLFAR